MSEKKQDFISLPWRWGEPRTQADVSRCRWMLPRALVSVSMSLQPFDVPQSAMILGEPKKQMMAQVLSLQGPPMMVLNCRCPELLEYVKEDQHVAVKDQIKDLLPREEFCRICPFWAEREGKSS